MDPSRQNYSTYLFRANLEAALVPTYFHSSHSQGPNPGTCPLALGFPSLSVPNAPQFRKCYSLPSKHFQEFPTAKRILEFRVFHTPVQT